MAHDMPRHVTMNVTALLPERVSWRGHDMAMELTATAISRRTHGLAAA